jgi:hypothetical protein
MMDDGNSGTWNSTKAFIDQKTILRNGNTVNVQVVIAIVEKGGTQSQAHAPMFNPKTNTLSFPVELDAGALTKTALADLWWSC